MESDVACTRAICKNCIHWFHCYGRTMLTKWNRDKFEVPLRWIINISNRFEAIYR